MESAILQPIFFARGTGNPQAGKLGWNRMRGPDVYKRQEDTYSPLEKQYLMMKMVLKYYDEAGAALQKGADIEKAVSYTHLDVYKRQRKFWSCCSGAASSRLTSGSSRTRSLRKPLRRRPAPYLQKMRRQQPKRCACCRNMRLKRIPCSLPWRASRWKRWRLTTPFTRSAMP